MQKVRRRATRSIASGIGSDYLHQFRHDCHLTLVGAREDEGFKLGIGRLQCDLCVLP